MIPRRYPRSQVRLTRQQWVRRSRLELAKAMFAALVLAAAGLMAHDPPAAWETSLFRAINDLPRLLEWVLWPIQQMGMIVAVPIGGAILWRMSRHHRPALGLLSGGLLGWGAARVMKSAFDRGRPGLLLDDVQLGVDAPIDEFGFPSGHATVAFILATVLAPHVSPRWRWLPYFLAGLVCLSRVFEGAHMPLDVVAGGAFGVAVGVIVNLSVGVRRELSQPDEA